MSQIALLVNRKLVEARDSGGIGGKWRFSDDVFLSFELSFPSKPHIVEKHPLLSYFTELSSVPEFHLSRDIIENSAKLRDLLREHEVQEIEIYPQSNQKIILQFVSKDYNSFD